MRATAAALLDPLTHGAGPGIPHVGMVFTECKQIPKKKAKGICSTAALPENAERSQIPEVVPGEDSGCCSWILNPLRRSRNSWGVNF